ncbi:MAG: DUF3857 domain-containing protein [Balneola sp.]
MIKNTFIVFILVVAFSQNKVWAQEQSFGDVSQKIMEMEFYEKDSTADAVVLFDVGEVYVNEDLEVRFKRKVRIKVLTDKGLDSGDISIRYRDEDPDQSISGIKAESYYLDEKGDFRKSKLGRRDKFTSEVSDSWKEIKFTIPGLRKGSVFDYEYEMKSESPVDIPNWFFQREYPTVWSEYRVFIPEWFNYLIYTRGYNDFTLNSMEKYNDMALFNNGSRLSYQGTKYHFIMRDIPSIQNEPYMSAKVNYLSQVRFQLSSYQFPQQRITNVLNTWPSLVEAINESDNYGKKLKSYSNIKKDALRVSENKESEIDKMIAIYDYLSSYMKWDDSYGLYVDRNLDRIYEEGTGTGTEINLILTQMLRDIGLNSDPVVISTRNNGEIIDIYPIDNQFNHTIVRVKINDQEYLLDAKNAKRPYNLLPVSDINGKGLVISDNEITEWVTLQNNQSNNLQSLLEITVQPDGTLNGDMESTNTGFFAYLLREAFSSESKEDTSTFKKLIFNEEEKVEIDSVRIIEDVRTGLFKYKMGFEKSTESTQDVIYINPIVIDAITENPFKKDVRKYPIDYEFNHSKTTILNYNIPDGWLIDETPASKAFKLEDGAIFYRRIIETFDDKITIRYDFLLNELQFEPARYDELKALYDVLSKANSEMIVLKRKEG